MKITDNSVVDFTALMERVGDDEEFLRELFDLFHPKAEMILTGLARAISESNAPEVDKLAHDLKGMCLNMSCEQMHPLAYQLEHMGKAADLTGAVEILASLNQAYQSVKQVASAFA